jgi:L-threonylcarbamoyladenylate synthase
MNVIGAEQLDLAARAVEAGELVIIPTDRWYMLCCDANNAAACARIFDGKRRPPDKSLLLVAPSVDLVRQWFLLPAEGERLADQLWPGDLALRLCWRDPVNGSRHAGVGNPVGLVTVAPDILGELARRCAAPVAATSANVSAEPVPGSAGPAVTLDEVRGFISRTDTAVAFAVDGGICPRFQPLTIVDCTGEGIQRERDGAVSEHVLKAALNDKVGCASG